MHVDSAGASERRPAPADLGGLVMAAAAGDDRAWDELVARLASVVSDVAAAHGLGEVATTLVFGAVWRRLAGHLGQIRQPDRVAVWVGAVARHECLRALGVVAPDGSA